MAADVALSRIDPDPATEDSFGVRGMHCGSCVGRVQAAAAAVPGVEEAVANLASERLTVRFRPPASRAAIAEAVRAAGYPIEEETARLAIAGMSCASCVGRVEAALAAVPGAADVSVNLATGEAVVAYDPDRTGPAELAGAVAALGYAAEPVGGAGAALSRAERREEEIARYRSATVIAAVLGLPVVILAMGGHWIPAFHDAIMSTIGRGGSWVIQFVLTTVVLAWPGRIFIEKGIPALLRRAPEMNSLVAIGTLSAWGYSTVATFLPGVLPEAVRDVYFEAAVVIVALILAGRWMEARAKGRTGAAIERLVRLRPDTARVVENGTTREIPVAALRPGMVVEVLPGQSVPTDGEVVDGSSFVNEAMITGEPVPAEKGPGDAVVGGTLNTSGAFSFRVTRTGEDTVLSQIIRMVEDAQAAKLPVQDVIDRITAWFVPAVMTAAALTVAVWLLFGPDPALTMALVSGVSVLIVACPCAMGLATPTSIMVGTGRAAELGVLFRRGAALQVLAGVDVIAVDKTGTLTEGMPALTDVIAAEGADRDEVLALAASLETRSEHPIARAVVAGAAEAGLETRPVERFTALAGMGIAGRVAGAEVLAGTDRLLRDHGVAPEALLAEGERLSAEGKTPLFVAVDGRLAGVLGVADRLRPGARAAIRALRDRGIRVVMVTGDAPLTAQAVARSAAIDEVVARVMPDAKAAEVERLKAEGRTVAFVGDGINDAPALAAADVGIAVGTGTDVAIESADVVLMSGDPAGIANAVAISRATMRNVRENLFWAFGYNVALIPVAAGLLYPVWGMLLSPMLAAGAMALSSVFVVSNALRLRWARGGVAAREGAA